MEDGGTVDLTAYLDDTDDQTVTAFAIDNVSNVLTITLENGNTRTVDLSALDNAGTDDQQLTLATNTLTLEDGGTVDLSGYLDNTDDQNIESLGLAGNILTVGIENGTAQTVDLSALDNTGTDDQQLTLAANTLTLEDGGTVDLSGYLDNTDEQNLTLSGTDLSIDDGNTVDLSGFVSTDDQNISGSGLTGTDLTIGIENGTNEVVDLSSLVGTDDQNLTLVGNTLTLEDGGTVDLTAYLDDTDDQTVTAFAIDNVSNVLAITLENGNTRTVDLSALDNAGTDDQQLTLATNTLTLEDGGTVDLSGYLDNTDEQNLTLSGTDLSIDDGNTVDLSGFVSTDDQNISGSGLTGTDLTIGIENGTNEVVDLSSLVGTDDQNIESLGLAGNILTVGIENGTAQTVDLSALDNAGTDDQQLTLATNTLTLEDGGTVDLSGYLDNTDEQNLTGAALNASNILQIDIENGTSTTVDLSVLDNAGTDNQNIESLALTGTTLTVGIEDGTAQTVDLASIDTDTDEQDLTGATLTGNTLQIDIENGASTTVDLSALNNSGTDNQNLTGATLNGSNILQIDIEDGTSTTVDLSSLNNTGTDNQNISGSGLSGTDLTIGIENGTNQVVDLSSLANTDNQNIENLGLSGTTLTVGIEDGSSQTVNLASLLGTDNQRADVFSYNPASRVLSLSLQRDGEATRTVDLSSLNNSGTDNQNLSTNGNPGHVAISGGTATTINVNDGDFNATNEIQDLSISGNVLSLTGDATTVTLPTPDGTETVVEAAVGSELSVTGDGSSSTPYIINNLRPNIFYPPSIAIDVSAYSGTTITNETIDLYAQYQAQYGSPMVSSAGPGPGNTAPAAIPTYASNELYYYVTLFDTSVFDNISIDENGLMTYDIIGSPADYNSLINVVFVVK